MALTAPIHKDEIPLVTSGSQLERPHPLEQAGGFAVGPAEEA